MMDTEESYLIQKAKVAQSTDPSAAKAWILAAKTLYPNNFAVQFEAYSLEKNALNFEEAAKCLSYIVVTFPNQSDQQLWHEIAQLTAALRTPVEPSHTPLNIATSPPAVAAQPHPTTGSSSTATEPVNFYVKMFQHIAVDVQHTILNLIAGHPDSKILDHCRLLLLLVRRFPAGRTTHAPRLLESLVQGCAGAPNAAAAQPFRELLIGEALPLVHDAPPMDLGAPIVHRIMATAFEYHINQMFRETGAVNGGAANGGGGEHGTSGGGDGHEHWDRLFDTLALCGRMLKWEPYVAYQRSRSMDSYWQALCQILAAAPPRPSENKQILFCATILFVMSLQGYMRHVRPATTTATTATTTIAALDFVLVEGFQSQRRADGGGGVAETGAAQITATSAPCCAETGVCLVTATNCWQLLHSNEILQSDFSQLLRTVPLSAWIARFLVDLAFYVGSADEARAVLAEAKIGQLERDVRVLSLVASQPLNIPVLFECMMKTLADMPPTTPPGNWVTDLTSASATVGRYMVLLPLSRRAIVQYCTKILVGELRLKVLADPARCSDSLLGNLLVLLQLDWPAEYQLAEKVFAVIAARGAFTYLPFGQYVIEVDLIEQFMSMWYPHGGDVHLVFTSSSPGAGGGVGGGSAAAGTRRIGTRGADKGMRDDFKLAMRKQIRKCNEQVDECVERFIGGEQMQLMQNLFEK